MPTTRTTRRNNRRPLVSVGALAAATTVALAPSIMVPATANAVSSSDFVAAQNRLVAGTGSPTGTCFGLVSTTINPIGYPNSATVSWAFGIVGIGHCNLTVTLSWQNLNDSKKSGEEVVHIPAPLLANGVPNPINHPMQAVIDTGPGEIEYTLRTNAGGWSGPMSIQTPAYVH
ncbi:MAG TPA: hypothetical protein H9878_08145 [Candidatus Dietzia merdigallinarum]|nr:hypothetical protein [Candidatus Dietzia merdigallinarum]